jgi:hypothetical protein
MCAQNARAARLSTQPASETGRKTTPKGLNQIVRGLLGLGHELDFRVSGTSASLALAGGAVKKTQKSSGKFDTFQSATRGGFCHVVLNRV